MSKDPQRYVALVLLPVAAVLALVPPLIPFEWGWFHWIFAGTCVTGGIAYAACGVVLFRNW